ncbi:MAG: hypothetical protein ACREPT_03415, partial [Rudaea sp.]
VGDPNKVADVGHPLTLTANVYGNNPTGPVTFTGTTPFISGTATLCADVQLAQGVAICTTSAISPSGSTTTVVAKYAGDAVNASSSDQIAVYGAYLIVVTSSANPAQANQPIDLVAHVDGGAADEQLTFYDGTTLYNDAQPLCSSVPTVTANGAQFAHCAVTFATPGDHLITVVPSTRSEWNAADPQIIVQRVTAAQSFDADQFALTGTYASPGAKGQGLLLEVYTDHKAPGQGSVGGGWFAFDTAGNPQWYTLQGDMDQAHGSTFPVNLYQTTGGAFNAPPSVAASQVGTGELTFFDCAHAALSYSFADGRTGALPYTRLSSPSNCSAAVPAVSQSPLPANYNDALHSGAWYNPSESGQGVIVDVIPSQKLLFAAWYTYAPASEGLTGNSAQRWFTLQPSGYTPGTLVLNDVPIYSTTGGSFNSMMPVSTTQVGAANIAFTSCSSLSIVYLFTSGEFAGLSGSFATQTLSLPAQCQ